MSKHSGLILFALATGAFGIGTTEFASMGLLPFFAHDLNVDEPTAGHAISAYALGVVVGAPIITVMAAKISKKTLLISLMLMFILGNILSAVASTYPAFVFCRFLTGLPHGAYYGAASLLAASLVEVNRRAWAVSRMFIGATTAMIIGVPATSWIGHSIGWRWGFAIAALVGVLTTLLIFLHAPEDKPDREASALRELKALTSAQVLLTLAISCIGFGGLFAVYTYLSVVLIKVTHTTFAFVPFALGVLGLGMTLGNLTIPKFADRALMGTAAAILISTALFLMLFPLVVHYQWMVALDVFMIGFSISGLCSVLQTRLMEVAQDAQSLAAAMNHAAFNVANALGPWLAGLAITAGYGWASIGWVGALMTLGGLPFLIAAVLLDKKQVTPKNAFST
ncbi:MAG: MFS transporter [Pseudomonadota bacterium]